MNVKPRNNIYKAVYWTGDNIAEVKHFCGKDCTITYETTPLDDFFLLKVKNTKGEMTEVPSFYYILKLDECGHKYLILSNNDFIHFFQETEEEPVVDEDIEPIGEYYKQKEIISAEVENPQCIIKSVKEPLDNPNMEDIEIEGSEGPSWATSPAKIPEGSKVLIHSCRNDKHSGAFFIGREGKVVHYWANNPFGEYNVYLDDGCNNTFDRDELEML